MTITVTIDADLAMVFTHATGKLDVGDVHAHRIGLREHPDYRPGMNHLIDLREAKLAPEPAELRHLVSEDPFDGGGRRALLVADDLLYGMGRMYEMLAEQRRIAFRPFRSLADACAWLGIPEERARAALEMPPEEGADGDTCAVTN